MKGFKHNLYIYLAVATAVLTLAESVLTILDIQNLDNGWMITRIYCLILVFGSGTSMGLAKMFLNKPLFFIHLVLTGITTGFMVLLTVLHTTNLTWVMKFWDHIYAITGFVDMEIFIFFFIYYFLYYFLLGITGIILLVKRKWQPGACLVVVAVAMIWIFVSTGPNSMLVKLTAIIGVISTAAWLVIAWSLKQEQVHTQHETAQS